MAARVLLLPGDGVGTEGELCFTGRSLVADPRGAKLAEAPEKGEHVKVVDCDPARARDKGITPRNDLFADRRPELYRGIADD